MAQVTWLNPEEKKGLLVVITGDGKGKTAGALGRANGLTKGRRGGMSYGVTRGPIA